VSSDPAGSVWTWQFTQFELKLPDMSIPREVDPLKEELERAIAQPLEQDPKFKEAGDGNV